ncbi:ankyrin [Apiospora marii]|uniref:Ankyrin n=1 Tax=Apiospora marii TaxID=335849 RepID=A0ABR1RZW7_9PEZI
MDPVSVISTTLGVFGAISQLKTLLDKYRDAPKQIEDTLQHCSNIETILCVVRELIPRNRDALTKSKFYDKFMAMLTSSTDGIKSTLQIIRKELPKIDSEKKPKSKSRSKYKSKSKLGYWDGVKFVWDEAFFQKQLEVLKEHHEGIRTLNDMITSLAVTHGFARKERRSYADAARGTGSTPIQLERASEVGQKSADKASLDKLSNTTTTAQTGETLNDRLQAALNGRHSKDITALLKQGAEIDAELDSSGNRALHVAARNGDFESVRTLRRHAADMMIQNNQGCTPLMVALQSAHVSVSNFILETQPSLTSRDVDGKVALHYAVEAGLLEPTRELITMGADVNSTDTEGRTPLHYAFQHKAGEANLEVIRSLLDAGADPTTSSTGGVTPVHLAAEAADQEEALRLLVAKAKSLEIGAPLTPLVKAASHGRTGSLRVLLDAGAKIDPVKDGASALASAFEGKHFDSFSFLLERGADPNVRKPSDPKGRYLLHLAATEETPFGAQTLECLLKQHKTKIDIRDKGRETPLFQAVCVPCIPAVIILLKHGADPIVSNKTISARAQAVETGNLTTETFLASNG